ncbi:MAG: hypothetical protein M1820_001371 [Bogoriella megaspora]|nr:MAG: hypothetical protein M1820_001371 [Bogoriella megaspora]
MSTLQRRIIPAPGDLPHVRKDAVAAFQILKAGGIIIVPTDVGYGIMSSSAEGIPKAFTAKGRAPGHTLGIIGTYKQHLMLHDLPPEKFEITRVITQELSPTLAVVARYKKDHPRLQKLSKQTIERVTKGDTLGIAIPEGPFLRELGRLNDEDGQLMVGSSANLSGQGQKFRIEDIEPEILDCADLVVDYGLQRYWNYSRAGTNFDMDNMRVLRIGAGYEVFRYRMKKWFGIELPDDPDYNIEGTQFGVSIKLAE